MPYIDNATLLKAPPAKVWGILTDLSAPQDWGPLVQLSGTAALGAVINYSVQLGSLRQPFHSTATVTVFKKSEMFGWSIGFKRILRFQETYKISAHPSGTRLIHQLYFMGFFARPWCWLMRRSMLASLIIVDRSFERHVEELLAAKGSPLSRDRPARHIRNQSAPQRKRRVRG